MVNVYLRIALGFASHDKFNQLIDSPSAGRAPDFHGSWEAVIRILVKNWFLVIKELLAALCLEPASLGLEIAVTDPMLPSHDLASRWCDEWFWRISSGNKIWKGCTMDGLLPYPGYLPRKKVEAARGSGTHLNRLGSVLMGWDSH